MFWPLTISNPRSRRGKSFLWLMSRSSPQARSLTRLRILGSFFKPSVSIIVSLTLFATLRLRAGSISSASGGARLSRGKHRRAIVRSKSSRNDWFPGALGARWVVAKLSAEDMSPSVVAVHLRINSMSCKRKRAKWSEGSISNICF